MIDTTNIIIINTIELVRSYNFDYEPIQFCNLLTMYHKLIKQQINQSVQTNSAMRNTNL